MITIGLTTWSDHPLIASDKKRQLEDYASHFPFVEMDTSYYGIPSEKSIESWFRKTPETFQFIPKAYYPMTLHKPWEDKTQSLDEIYSVYIHRFQPMIAAGKIKAFLFQFPPFFRFNEKNKEYLRKVKNWMGPLPVAIEFRHASWYSEANQDRTLEFLKTMQFIHVVVDQPQTPTNSVPTILKATNEKLTLYRLHGQNYSGWLNASEDRNWRENRTLHDYTKKELLNINKNALELEKQSNEVAVIFNNNSGGHAAKNAKELQEIAKIEFEGLHPQQLNLF